jgi:hypothetical protein
MCEHFRNANGMEIDEAPGAFADRIVAASPVYHRQSERSGYLGARASRLHSINGSMNNPTAGVEAGHYMFAAAPFSTVQPL